METQSLPLLRFLFPCSLTIWCVTHIGLSDWWLCYAYPFTPLLLDGCHLLYTNTYSAMTRLFVLVSHLFGRVVHLSCIQYKRLVMRYENSKRVLFYTNTSRRWTCLFLYLCTTILGQIPYTESSWVLNGWLTTLTQWYAWRLRITLELASRNNEHPGRQSHHSRRLRNRKGIPPRNIPHSQTSTNRSPSFLSHYMLHCQKLRTRIPSSSVGLPQGSVGTTERSFGTTR